MAQHNSFVMIVNAALGGGDKNKAPVTVNDAGVKNLGAGHASVEDAISAINNAMLF